MLMSNRLRQVFKANTGDGVVNKLIAALFAVLLALGTPAFAQKGGADSDNGVMHFAGDDVQMNAARTAARDSYPQFRAAFNNASAGEREFFMVKLALTDSTGELEHIWVDSLHLNGDRLMGRLANVPVDLPNMSQGSLVEVRADLISDWSITRVDGMYGNFTTRVMIDRMPAREAEPYRAALAPTPLPPDWAS